MKLISCAVIMASALMLTGWTDADRLFDRLCDAPSADWVEPSADDFASDDAHFGFLNRRASWARAIEMGRTDDTYFEWLLARYRWHRVTFADRDYACYSHLTRR